MFKGTSNNLSKYMHIYDKKKEVETHAYTNEERVESDISNKPGERIFSSHRNNHFS